MTESVQFGEERQSLKLESHWAHRHLYAKHTAPSSGTLSVLFTLALLFILL